MREVEDVAAELGLRVKRVGRVFDVRWLSSSYAVRALWDSYPAQVKHRVGQRPSPVY